MKQRLLDLLVCPIDKTPLELLEWETTPKRSPRRTSNGFKRWDSTQPHSQARSRLVCW